MTDKNTTGMFYLGREYDIDRKEVRDKPVHYNPRDLTTHGVVVGMTGSGKTGLCVNLVTEAALQGIPTIVVDLKGDLSNMLLQFPQLRPEDFEPWVDPDDARRHNTSVEEYARQLSETWKQGLAEWNLGPDRIQQLQDRAEWRIYTPGSEAGLPVSVIQNFTAPATVSDREALNDRVEATTTAILGLTKVSTDPVQSREHILISNLLLHAWLDGRDLDLPHLINEITHPPLRKIGAFDIDMFYPEEERLGLALALNNLLASPSFSGWITGDPLDLNTMLYDEKGKPRQLIFYLAHLDDSQRMFFLTLLLGEVVNWMRDQQGASNLRALLYLDEIFGYLPPHPANPPTKRPLLTLLKQGRAFGVGALLATQNPMDIDYKALTNAGTWFVGKLQTDRDKSRLLGGLEGVSAERGTITDRKYLDTAISSLGNQVFLLHDVHEDKPILFHTRWALSYLYGPMTREQINHLMADVKKHFRTNGAPVRPVGTPGHNTRLVGPTQNCTNCQGTSPIQAHYCMECGQPFPEPHLKDQEPEEELGEAVALASSNPMAPANVPPILPSELDQFFLPLPETAQDEDEDQRIILYEARLLAFAEVTFKDGKHKFEYEHTYRLITIPPNPAQPEPWEHCEQIDLPLQIEPPQKENVVWSDVPPQLNDPKKMKELEKEFTDFLFNHAMWNLYYNRTLGLLSKPHEDEENFLERCQENAQEASARELAEWEEEQEGASRVGLAWEQKRQSRQSKLDAKWQKKATETRPILLTPRKTDIHVTHFGLVWTPYLWDSNSSEATHALYPSQCVTPDNWRGGNNGTGVEDNEGTPGN